MALIAYDFRSLKVVAYMHFHLEFRNSIGILLTQLNFGGECSYLMHLEVNLKLVTVYDNGAASQLPTIGLAQQTAQSIVIPLAP